jgi:outer membrane protein OmpA-like peptidoglycan-associated protein
MLSTRNKLSLGLLLGVSALGFAPAAPADEDPLYAVYFNVGSDVLTRQAAAILNYVAKDYVEHRTGRPLLLTGHADSGEVPNGNDSECVSLGLRRIANVTVYLEGQGVPYESMKAESLGCRAPVVEGVKGPENQRVEMRLGAKEGS